MQSLSRLMTFLYRTRTKFPKFVWKHRRHQIAEKKKFDGKKANVEGSYSLISKLHYPAIVVTAGQSQHRCRHADQQSRAPRSEPVLTRTSTSRPRWYCAPEKRTAPIKGTRKSEQLYAKESNWTTHTICKSKLKMD